MDYLKKSVILLGIALLLASCSQAAGDQGEEEKAAVKQVKVTSVEQRSMGDVLAVAAEVVPSAQTRLYAEAQGTIGRLYVRVGDRVEKGDPLVQILNPEIDLNLKGAELQKRQAQIQLEQSQAKEDISLETQLKQATVDYENALELYERKKALYESGAISELELRDLRAKLEKAENQLDSVKKQLNELHNEYDVRLMEAKIEEADLNYEKYQLQKNRTLIRAPFAGRIVELPLSPSQQVSQGQELGLMEAYQPLYVRAALNERDYLALKGKKELDVVVDAFDREVKGKIRHLTSVPQDGQRRFMAEVEIENPAGDILPGMSAKLVLDGEYGKEVPVVPVSAVMEEDGKAYVYVAEDDRAVRKTIETGRMNREYAEVVSGLTPGDRVIYIGQHDLENGDQVKILD